MAHMVILAARWQLVSTSNIGRVVDKCHNVFDQVELTWVIAYKASEEQFEETLVVLKDWGVDTHYFGTKQRDPSS